MATNVSLLGSAGSTITLPITSANNAAAAQAALAGISDAVAGGSLGEVDASGPNLPAATRPTIVLSAPTGAAVPFQLGNGYVGAVLDGPALQGVASGVAPNETVISSTAGAVVANFAVDTQVFFGGGNNALEELGGLGLDPSAQVWLDGSGYFEVSAGETTVFAGTGASLDLVNNGDGANVVDFQETNANAAANMIGISGTSEAAATVNAVGAGLIVLQDGGAAVINAHGSDVTVYGTPGAGWNGQGSVSLFGGAGTDVVGGGTGYFHAGAAGNSLIASSTVAGAATLVGGGNGDTLMARGSGDVMVAGPGNETLTGGTAPVVEIGSSDAVGAVHPTVSMAGGASGGSLFYIGNGTTYVTANHGSAGGNVFDKLTLGPNNNAVITGFLSAEDASGAAQANPDMIALWRPDGGRYQLEQGAAPGPGQITFSYGTTYGSASSAVQFDDGATWTFVGTILHPGDFV